MTPRKTTSIHPAPGGGPYGVQVTREPVRRSWLVVSSIDDGQVAQAWTSAADVIVLDLEDSIHDSKKPLGRERIPEAVPTAAKGGAEVFIRPDIEMLYADLEASILPGVTGVVLPKVSSADQVREADQVIVEMEQRRGMPGVIELHLSLETGPGGYYAVDIAKSSSRVRSIGTGRADLVMDLRGEPSGDLHLMPYLVERMVLTARVAGVEPFGAYWRANSRGTVASPEATLQAAIEGRARGFKGALCARTNQVEPLNTGFTPQTEEVDRAMRLVESFEQARAQGIAAGLHDREPVDAARAQAARQVIDFAELCALRDRAKQAAVKAAGG